jgi:hypothetical protein
MPKIKLKEWADKHNLSYLTANRHFHAGMIPGAMQLDSGTILVEDDSLEQTMAGSTSNDAMSLFLRKTVEFSKNNSSVEDFAAYVISNFQLKLNSISDSPKYSKNKPKAEEVQKHFQKFIPDPKNVEHLKAVKTLLKEGKTAGDVVPSSLSPTSGELPEVFPTVDNTSNDYFTQSLDEVEANFNSVFTSSPTEGLVTRSVDCNTTPQQINYTGSTSQTFSGGPTSSIISSNMVSNSIGDSFANNDMGWQSGGLYFNGQGSFQPTQKELMSAAKVIETAETEDLPRKRGRKPSKKR